MVVSDGEAMTGPVRMEERNHHQVPGEQVRGAKNPLNQ